MNPSLNDTSDQSATWQRFVERCSRLGQHGETEDYIKRSFASMLEQDQLGFPDNFLFRS